MGGRGRSFSTQRRSIRNGARVVARLADGTPLLMDKQMGEGHVLLFASGFDNVTNDLPLHPGFVPFVDQTARYLSGEERVSGARVVDSFVQLRNPANGAAGRCNGATVEVIGPDGKRPLSLKEAATAQSFQLTRAGFYQMRFANGQDALIAVNPDRRESDLAAIPDDVLKLWSGSAAAGTAATRNGGGRRMNKQRISLWWWVMLMLAIAAVAESVCGQPAIWARSGRKYEQAERAQPLHPAGAAAVAAGCVSAGGGGGGGCRAGCDGRAHADPECVCVS